MALLDGLDAVDWARYHHAYGPANDVPVLLRAIAFPESAKVKVGEGGTLFRTVTETLWSNVFHQGSVWGVSAKVIPFLVELLGADLRVEARRFLVEYLHHLAIGYPGERFPDRFEIERVEAAAAQVEAANLPQAVLDGDAYGDAAHDIDPAAIRHVGEVWVRDCYTAVESRLEEVVSSLEDADDTVVARTVALLASFPRRAAITAPPLWKLAKDELDNPIGAMALVALAQLGREGVSEAAQVFSDALTDSGIVYAAFADLLASKSRPSPVSQHCLLNVRDEWKDLSCPFSGTLGTLTDRALLMLPPEAIDEVIKALSESLRRSNGFVPKLNAVKALLRVSGIKGTADLDSRARTVLRVITEHADWGQFSRDDMSDLLLSYGLPGAREELERLNA